MGQQYQFGIYHVIKQFLQHSGTFVFSALQSAGIGRLASKFFSVT